MTGDVDTLPSSLTTLGPLVRLLWVKVLSEVGFKGRMLGFCSVTWLISSPDKNRVHNHYNYYYRC